MGIFRGGFLVIFSVLFLLGLLVQGFFLTVYLSLDYDTLNPQLSSVASDLLEEQGIPSEINSSFIDEQVSEMIEEKYYQSYDCKFFDCIKKTSDPFSLVSRHAQDYWRTKFFSFLVIPLLLLGAVFLLVENKSNFFFLSSALFAISSFMFLKLEFLAGFILKPFFSIGDKLGDLSFSSFLELFSVFLIKSPVVFVYFLTIGILFLVLGLIMKLFGIGFGISGFFNKVSEMVKKKEEVQPSSEVKREVAQPSSVIKKKEETPVIQPKVSKKTVKKSGIKKKSK